MKEFKDDIEKFKGIGSRILKEFKGTKGKWHAVEYAGTFIIQDGEMYENVNILDSDNFDMKIVKANAQLIATAPELLTELYRTTLLLKALPEIDEEISERIESAEQTINKALGL